MDGILVIDKPAGLTSHDVVARVRRILKTKRVGHTGTLDPFATGVLVVLIGKATRLARFLDKDVKAYEAEIRFGYETDTGDVTGRMKDGVGRRKAEGEMRDAERGTRNEDLTAKLASVDWDEVLHGFRGEIMQTPPMYSAKKVEGKKLYELARAGADIERKPVRVVIHILELMPNEFRGTHSTFRIQVVCSAGTYVRTLAEDIGRHVGIGAHLLNLRRTAAGKFDLTESISLEDLDSMETPEQRLLPIEEAVSHLPEVVLSTDRIDKTRSGLSSRVDSDAFKDGEFVRMTGDGVGLIAIGVYSEGERSVQPRVVLN